jgi:hypothetical protein
MLKLANKFSIVGRIQSREYQKKVGDDVIIRMAYEISVNKIQISGQEESETEPETDTIDSIV